MSIFESIFGRKPEAPRSAEEPATDHIWPGDIRKSLRRKGFSKTEAAAIYFHLFDPRDGLISVAVDAGKDVHLTGLGKFTRREMGAGQRELPDGEVVDVPARHYPAWENSRKWRDHVSGKEPIQ